MKRLSIIVLVLLFGCSFSSPAAQEITLARGRDLLLHGSYKEAIAVFTALIDKNTNDAGAIEGLVRAQIEIGEYAAADKRAREYLRSHPGEAGVRVALGEVELETGQYAEAASEFERASADSKGSVWLRARLGRAGALRIQGKEDEARAAAQELVRYYNTDSPASAEELTLIAEAARILEKPKDANELFIDAREADPTFVDAFNGQGELMNATYNYGDAASLFADALKVNPNSTRALIGLAASKQFESNEAQLVSIYKALEVNPNCVAALVHRASIDLEVENLEAVTIELDRAFKVNPNALDAIAVRASMFFLADKKAEFDSEIKRALAINPRAGEVFETLAVFAVNNRRYTDAVEFGRRAVELSPNLGSARTQLGIQLLRVGKVDEGRAQLDRAFAGDPFNVWAKNSLDLLDSMKDYVDTVRGPFIIKSEPKESGALSAYAADLAEEAHKMLTAKYRFTPRSPISIEVFPNHEDFAVRSLGLPGLGALGVCFGQVIAMDSPSARNPGEFNWGSTLWHEFTHVITLEMTDHRIPRWFSEGLSVFEERRARPGWGDNWSLENLKAISEGKFVKITELDAAFTRPKTPNGVALAYFQASQVCEFVDEKFGFDGILKMLALYKEGVKTIDVLQRVLKLTPAEFDRAFNDFIRAKSGAYIEAIGTGPVNAPAGQTPSKEALLALAKAKPNDYFANLRLGAFLKKEGDVDQAIGHLRRAAELFPYYGGPGNPHTLLAEIYESKGQKPEAAAALETLVRYNETDAGALAKIARLKLDLGDRKGAAEALKQSFYIQPFDASLHKLAGGVYLELGNPSEAIREFRVQIALEPPDLAEAHYDLARAHEAAGNKGEARREVIRSLEIAPGFEKAQGLLLKLRANK
ncbi:MAG TPA: tetratricopeptide repeat protein [Blastocatellia bacterium]|nr:tetratricopeptide repeat protein [Blastocatellia bacterium]